LRDVDSQPYQAGERNELLHRLLQHDAMERVSSPAAERLGVEPVDIRSGHCPNVSQPDRLAGILVDLDCPFGFTHAGDG
jgi:hypothetical protein